MNERSRLIEISLTEGPVTSGLNLRGKGEVVLDTRNTHDLTVGQDERDLTDDG